ncbi:MAG TPA: L,D-transpeptidase [Abditibacteriaceae bacterium]|nr:L,D-transpeptidase [Abditibacteriaceae bacterium]
MMQRPGIFAAPRPGQYCLAAALIGSMLCSIMLCRIAVATEIHSEIRPGTRPNSIPPLPPPPEEVGLPALSPTPEPTAPIPLPTPVATAPTGTPLPAPSIPQKPPAPQKPPGTSLRQAAQRLKLPWPLSDTRIVVTKSARRLDLYSGATLIKSYRVSLGAQPAGHKRQQGDGRTPEGQFYICTRNASTSVFHIFLGLSYPALPDATRAAQKKIISRRQYQLIRQRLSARGVPLWRTRLGGWVGIHGGTDAAFAQRKMKKRGTRDWTAGCIALTNREIAEIYTATRLGTPVLVRP